MVFTPWFFVGDKSKVSFEVKQMRQPCSVFKRLGIFLFKNKNTK